MDTYNTLGLGNYREQPRYNGQQRASVNRKTPDQPHRPYTITDILLHSVRELYSHRRTLYGRFFLRFSTEP